MRPRNFFKIKFMRILCFLLFFVNTITNAQKFTISGKVNDSNLLPLVGASILVGDNIQGTSSDNSGEFSLNLEQGNYKLIMVDSVNNLLECVISAFSLNFDFFNDPEAFVNFGK